MGSFVDWQILVPVVATSLLGAVVLVPRALRPGLAAAALHTLEALGYTMGFFVLNLLAGALFLQVLARLEGHRLSLYSVSDLSLLGLSLLQGLFFAAWRRPGSGT